MPCWRFQVQFRLVPRPRLDSVRDKNCATSIFKTITKVEKKNDCLCFVTRSEDKLEAVGFWWIKEWPGSTWETNSSTRECVCCVGPYIHLLSSSSSSSSLLPLCLLLFYANSLGWIGWSTFFKILKSMFIIIVVLVWSVPLTGKHCTSAPAPALVNASVLCGAERKALIISLPWA